MRLWYVHVFLASAGTAVVAVSTFAQAPAARTSAQDDIFAQPVLGFIPKPGWPPAGPVPRLADGKPDLSGPWAPNALRINNNTDSVIKDIPMQPWVADIPLSILQTPGLSVIIYEGRTHLWRQIFTDGRTHPADPNPTW